MHRTIGATDRTQLTALLVFSKGVNEDLWS